MKFRFSLLCLIAALLMFGNFALKARAVSSSDILVKVTPQNPAPYENISVVLNSYVNNLDIVFISWAVNGKTVASGIGKKSLSATAPAGGEEMSIIASISLPSGMIDARVAIKPSLMVLLWQANDSYVPPFYRGKALPAPDSEIKVVAMPEVRNNSGSVLPQNMVYYWRKDYTNDVDGSGYGKNFFLYINDYLEDSNNIKVVASTVDQKYSVEASINVGMTKPKILFYKNDSILGTLWNTALPSTHKIQGQEIVEAAPYFISPKEIQNPTLAWSWFINDNLVNLTNFKKKLMPLAVESGTHGTSRLRLEIENEDKIFQTASQEINIEF